MRNRLSALGSRLAEALATLFLVTGLSGAPAAQPVLAPAPTTAADSVNTEAEQARRALADRFGIEVVAVRLSAADRILDFRYRVLDTSKTSGLFGPGIHPFLIDEKSGTALAVPTPPKVGPLKSTRNRAIPGRTYFTFFANRGKLVQRGDLVTVQIGGLRITGLTVE